MGGDLDWKRSLEMLPWSVYPTSLCDTAHHLSFPHSSSISLLLEQPLLHFRADFMMGQKCQSIVWPSVGEHLQSTLACWAAFQTIIYCT